MRTFPSGETVVPAALPVDSAYARVRRRSLLGAIGALLVGWIVLTTCAGPDGADASRYVDWARAFATGDPFQLQSETFSPTGMPLSQWSHGPGLLAAPLVAPFGESALRALGVLATLGTAYFFTSLLRIATRGSRSQTMALLSVALVCTHWGFYALVHSSESLSYFPLSGMVYWLASP